MKSIPLQMVVGEVIRSQLWPQRYDRAPEDRALTPFSLQVDLPHTHPRTASVAARRALLGIEAIMDGDTEEAETHFSTLLADPSNTRVLNTGDSGGSEKSVRTLSN